MRPEIKLMAPKDMVKEYNQLTGKTITKFSSRAAGEKQLLAARAAAPQPRAHSPMRSEAAPKAKPAADRSAATAASWKDPVIAAKRAERTKVRVDGTEYRSTSSAMLALGLPFAKLIPFRMALKDEGKKVFEHNGKKYHFSVIN